MKAKAYYRVVQHLKRFGQGCVNAGNTLTEHSLAIDNEYKRKSLRSVAGILSHSGKLVQDIPRMDACMIQGDIGSVAYYGAHDAVKLSLLETLFPLGFEETQQRRVKLWQLPNDINRQVSGVGLIVCKVGRWFPWRLNAPIMFHNPVRVHQVVPLEPSIDEVLRGRSIRKRLNRYLRQEHQGWLSTQQQDFDFFYSKMYLPSAHHRFGAKIHVQPYEALLSWFQRGMLLLVALDGVIVSGSLIYKQNNTWFDGFSGFLNGDTKLLQQGASAVLYWYSLRLAIEHGARQANFIDSNAWTSDGVFEHKRSWGAIVQEDPYVLERLVFLSQDLSPQWQERLNAIGFLTQTKRGFLHIYYESATEQDDNHERRVAKAARMGLHGVRVISPHRKVDLYGSAIEDNGLSPAETSANTVSS